MQKLTLLDFPGRTACIVFTPGCKFRCPFCHNPELVLPELTRELPLISPQSFLRFLGQRKNLLDGVCLTGGEPTLQTGLVDFLAEIRRQGFQTKLDTNGANPAVLAELLKKGLLDYVAFDVKFAPENYAKFTSWTDFGAIQRTRDLLLKSQLDYEFRTTLVRELHTPTELTKIWQFIQGAKRYFLQNFEAREKLLDPAFSKMHGFQDCELQALREQAQKFVQECAIRS